MAISFVDKQTLDYSSSSTLAFTIPAGAQEDDLMIAFVKQSNNIDQQIWDDDGGGGNGWVQLDYHRTTGGRDQETSVYWKIHSGSESNPTFTWDSSASLMSGALMVYRGTDLVSPISDFAWSFQESTPNPTPPSVEVGSDDSWVVIFQAVTHDDITAVGMPSGYTNRSQVWNGTADDHRNHFVCDINNIDIQSSYDPPIFTHSTSATTPESQVYTLVLTEPLAIGINTYDTALQWGNTNKTVTGFGFEATQGSGKVEFWSDEAGTIKQAQSIDSWSDTSIQFDTVQGSLSDDVNNYIVITDDGGAYTRPKKVGFGLMSYTLVGEDIAPDHWWSFDGDYDDSINGYTVDGSVVGTPTWADAIAEDATQSMKFISVTDARELPNDSPYMNITIDSAERTVAGWIQLGGVQQSLASIWKEGGGVQNLVVLTGLGNVLMVQAADSPGNAINAQAVSTIKLTPNRPYHFALRYTLLEDPKEFRLYLDGEEQPYALTNGNPLGAGTFNSHSGQVLWGDPDGNLETGGTDIAYAGQKDCKYQHWASWSDNSSVGGAIEKVIHIRDVLFRRGALPKYTIDSDTEANMQSDLDTQLEDSEVEDYPLGIRIQKPSSGTDLELTANSITFNNRTTLQVEWRGVGELTWIVNGTSKVDESKFISTTGGTISFEYPAILTIEGVINTGELRLYDDNVGGNNYGSELDGTESNSGTSFSYSHSGASNNVIIQMIKDGYEEVIVPVTLGASNQTVTLLPKVDNNK